MVGWPLKSKLDESRFSENQKFFLDSKFLQREKSTKRGQAIDAVTKKMPRKVKDAKIQLFTVEVFLRKLQICSYFPCFAAKEKINK